MIALVAAVIIDVFLQRPSIVRLRINARLASFTAFNMSDITLTSRPKMNKFDAPECTRISPIVDYRSD